MGPNYERGDAAAPKGHALLYFRERGDPSKLYATYIIVLPLAIDMVKYMPPFLAPHLPAMNTPELSAFAFPPIPELVGGYRYLEEMAQARDDDLLSGGEVDPAQVTNLLSTVNEVVQEYAQAYAKHIERSAAAAVESTSEAPSELAVSEVLYQLMGERDRLVELARLIGKLRFAVEGNDQRQVQEAQGEVQALAKHLPDRYNIGTLIQAAKLPTRKGGELAQLYLDRCYKLVDEDYPLLKEVEERIRVLEHGPGPESAKGQ